MTTIDTELPAAPRTGLDVSRISTWFGVVFAGCQVIVMTFFAIAILPKGGSPSDPALERGRNVLDAADPYQAGNYVFMISGVLLLGFLGRCSTGCARSTRPARWRPSRWRRARCSR